MDFESTDAGSLCLPVRTRGAPTKAVANRRTKPRGRADRPLTLKQQLFCEAYMVHFNGTRAYLHSHPKANYGTARKEASRLLVHPSIVRQIEALRAGVISRYRHSADETLNLLCCIASAAISDAFDAQGALIPPNKMPREIAIAIRKLAVSEVLEVAGENSEVMAAYRTFKIELHDKVAALRLLAQHCGVLG